MLIPALVPAPAQNRHDTSIGALQVAVIAVTSVAANMSSILAGVLVFGDPMGRDPLEVAARIAGFVLVLVGAVLMPAPVRAAHSVGGPTPA